MKRSYHCHIHHPGRHVVVHCLCHALDGESSLVRFHLRLATSCYTQAVRAVRAAEAAVEEGTRSPTSVPRYPRVFASSGRSNVPEGYIIWYIRRYAVIVLFKRQSMSIKWLSLARLQAISELSEASLPRPTHLHVHANTLSAAESKGISVFSAVEITVSRLFRQFLQLFYPKHRPRCLICRRSRRAARKKHRKNILPC